MRAAVPECGPASTRTCPPARSTAGQRFKPGSREHFQLRDEGFAAPELRPRLLTTGLHKRKKRRKSPSSACHADAEAGAWRRVEADAPIAGARSPSGSLSPMRPARDQDTAY